MTGSGDGQFDALINYGAVDEVGSGASSATVTNQAITQTTNGDIYKLDISAIFASVAANDVFGVELTNDGTNSTDLYVMGMYLEFS
jgi:hypothetical protein